MNKMTQFLHVRYSQICRKCHFRNSKFQNLSGRACPQTPQSQFSPGLQLAMPPTKLIYHHLCPLLLYIHRNSLNLIKIQKQIDQLHVMSDIQQFSCFRACRLWQSVICDILHKNSAEKIAECTLGCHKHWRTPCEAGAVIRQTKIVECIPGRGSWTTVMDHSCGRGPLAKHQIFGV